MTIARTRVTTDIVAEVGIPSRRRTRDRVIVLAMGMPTSPTKKDLLTFLAGKGYHAILPRYRGTWESDGTFLRRSPARDITDIVDAITPEVTYTDVMTDEQFRLEPAEIHVIGSSFGGPAALFATNDRRVASGIALCPVVDFRAETAAEPHEWLKNALRAGFGNAYRFRDDDWHKLTSGALYNPITNLNAINPSKSYLIHTADDELVPRSTINTFLEYSACHATLLKRGGHLGTSDLCGRRMWQRVHKHMRTRARHT